MPTANPLEQLRRRMLSHGTPAAFAALAEEHRRAGRLQEAIGVCRDGLTQYPTYVSARVTLGRALLDSGDLAHAVVELEQAVAQAPDNLAAVRALDAARAAHAATPVAAASATLDDLVLHAAIPQGSVPVADAPGPAAEYGPADQIAPVETAPPAEAWGVALTVGVDGPQEFGLAADWSVPATGAADAIAVHVVDALNDPWNLQDASDLRHGHADAPTISFAAPYAQGDEPAGMWPVPVTTAPADADEPEAGAPVHGRSIAAPGEPPAAPPPAHVAGADVVTSIWDAPTIVSPVVETAVAADVDGEAAASVEASADPAGSGSGVWDGVFVGPVSDGAAPALFAGWDEPGPAVAEPPAWAGEDVTDSPEARAASWSLPESVPEPVREEAAGPTWEDDSLGVAALPAAPEALPAQHADNVGEARDASGAEPPPGGWAGSVASALDEVFALAGQPTAGAPHGQAPADASPLVGVAMAETAVDAAIEDVAQRDETLSPVLVSLQQMLDAVRARRAALFTEVES